MDSVELDPELPLLAAPYWEPAHKFQDRVWLHVLLLVLTSLTTTLIGSSYYENWATGIGQQRLGLSNVALYLHGAWYSLTVLLILGSHELGHYFACRYYDVDASLPFFLPFPFMPSGTLGAVIRIREPIPGKRMLFDIGIAGPIAGFVVAVGALIVGLRLSNVVAYSGGQSGWEFGEPLIVQGVSWVFWGHIMDGYAMNWHPLVFASWFGFLATALNLFPLGQLDGGHISYALIGRRSSTLTLVMIGCGMALSLLSFNWVVWTGLMIVMLFSFGRHHPRTFDEAAPLGAARTWLALFALVMFVVSFTPVPIRSL